MYFWFSARNVDLHIRRRRHFLKSERMCLMKAAPPDIHDVPPPGRMPHRLGCLFAAPSNRCACLVAAYQCGGTWLGGGSACWRSINSTTVRELLKRSATYDRWCGSSKFCVRPPWSRDRPSWPKRSCSRGPRIYLLDLTPQALLLFANEPAGNLRVYCGPLTWILKHLYPEH